MTAIMKHKNWQLKEKAPLNFIKKYSEYPSVVAQLLFSRGLKIEKEIEAFLNPNYVKDLHNPFLLQGMKEAVKRIKKAVEQKEKIAIYGDYDADGVTSSVLLVETFEQLGLEVISYIPDRAREGYGLNEKAVLFLIEQGVNLIITVDTGITGIKEVDLANENKVDVIITDHHHVPEQLPKAVAIIDPKRQDDKYPYKGLAGVGVAFKLVQALVQEKISSKVNERFEKWSLDLVAIGTVADVCSLLDENRTLVERGLVVLKKTKRLGLQEIFKIARIKTELIDSITIGYQISPRINAAGRMDHANTAYELLITKDKKRAKELAEELEEKNKKRQQLIDKIVKNIKKTIDCADPKKKVIFAYSGDWPKGVLGVIAGKLKDEFSKVVFIFHQGKEESTGSIRGVEGLNLVEAIGECKDLVVKFGGHALAAGLTIKNNKIKEFEKKFSAIAEETIKKEDAIPTLSIDTEISAGEINNSLCKALKKFIPFGVDNKEPLFIMENMQVVNKRLVGNNEKHLKLQVLVSYKDEKRNTYLNKYFNAIGFNFSEFYDILNKGDYIDLVFVICENHWNGETKIDLKIVDIKKKF